MGREEFFSPSIDDGCLPYCYACHVQSFSFLHRAVVATTRTFMRLLPVRITPSAWGKPALYPVVFEGEEFLVRKYMPDRAVLREVWEKRCYPAPQDGDIVMDIGANIGAYAVFASRAAKHVYAFEPEASNFEQLSQNIRHKKNITALRLAVAGSAGTRMLGTPRMSRNRSSLYDQSKGQEVHCVTLARRSAALVRQSSISQRSTSRGRSTKLFSTQLRRSSAGAAAFFWNFTTGGLHIRTPNSQRI